MFETPKLIAIGIVLAIAAAFAYSYHSRGTQNTALQKEVGHQEAVNDGLVHTVESSGKSAVVNEAAVADTGDQKQAIATSQAGIREKTQARVDALPSVPVFEDPKNQAAAVAAHAQAVSTARIEGLWESYCKTSPSDVDCTPPEPAPAAAAKEST